MLPRKVPRARVRLFVLTALSLLALPPVAAAETRTGSVSDPRDTALHEHVDGTSWYDPFDIAGVDVTYDTAGSVRIVVRFYDPLPAASYEGKSYAVGLAQNAEGGCYGTEKGDLSISLETPTEPLFPGAPSNGMDRMSLVGYEGQIPHTVELSADRRELVIAATHQALAGRAYACVGEGTIGSSWGSGCNEHRCWDGGTLTADTHTTFALTGPNGPQTVNKPERLPTLTKAAAKRYVRTSLARRFGNSFRHGYGYKRSCGRLSRVKVRCRVRWHIGDLSYSGPVTIWHSTDDGDVIWNYAWRIRRVNGYCKATGGRNCVTTHRVD